MSGKASRLPRWLGRRTTALPETSADTGTGGVAAAGEAPHTVVEEDGERFLLRSSADRRTSVTDLTRGLAAEPGRPVVVVDVAPEAAGNLGTELGGLFARLSAEKCPSARLVMSGAAASTAGSRPLAQRLADAWGLELEAPDATAVLIPGGGLYVTEPATRAGGWWRFSPGAEPEVLGARIPAPRWQRALARVPLGELGCCTVQQIPAGLFLRPAGTAAPRPGELAFALAVHPERLTVLVSSGQAARDVLAEDLATLLAGLPAELRRSVRLAPGDHHDLLPVAESVADLLDTEVEVCTGLPLAVPHSPDGTVHTESVRLKSPEDECTWPALLTAVVCSPVGPDGHRATWRPAHWLLPEAVGSPALEPATLRMPGGQYVVAVRAGLWVGGSAVPPDAVRDRPAEARAARIEVEETGTDDRARGLLLKALAALLPELDEQVREHAEIAAPAGAGPETLGALRRFAVRNGLTFAMPATPATAGPAEPALSEGASVSSGAPSFSPGAPVRPGALTSSVPAGVTTASSASEHAQASPVPGPGTPLPQTVTATVAATAAAPQANAAPVTGVAPSPPAATPPPVRPVTSSSTRAGESGTAARTPGVRSGTQAPESVAVASTAPARRAVETTEETPSAVPVRAEASATAAAPPGPPPPVARAASTRRTFTPPSIGFSSDGDREKFRELAAAVWQEHTGPVNQALTRLPALRGPGEAAARADLIAVHLYLASPPDGRFGAHALAAEASAGAGELAPYATCLASGLRRLPALRGTLVRAVPGPGITDDVVPGALLYCDPPLDVVHLEQKGAPLPAEEYVRYVIRPITARRTSVLASPSGNGTTALFAAGSEFSVLARHEAADGLPARVLLAEVPPGAGQYREPSAGAVARLEASACRPADPGGAPWPERCTGAFSFPSGA